MNGVTAVLAEGMHVIGILYPESIYPEAKCPEAKCKTMFP